jgi:hypothetical protein
MAVEEKITVTFDKPAGWFATQQTSPGSLGTESLPVEVTKQPVVVSAWSTTEEINAASGRPRGFYAIGLRLGERENPADLTADEREYVAMVLEFTARKFREGNPFATEHG